MNTVPDPRARDPREPLAQALRRAAALLDAQQPPATLADAVRQRVAAAAPGQAAAPPRPRRRPWAAWSGGAALAASLVLVTLVLWVQPPAPPLQARGGEFLPLVPREDWPDEAMPAWLVASELPPERLAALGLPYDPARPAEPVRAELLVHPSGLVLALRLID
jgi:hypothetical protein